MNWLTGLLIINAVLVSLDLSLRLMARDPLREGLPRHLTEREDLRTVMREALVEYGVQRTQAQALLDNMAAAKARAAQLGQPWRDKDIG